MTKSLSDTAAANQVLQATLAAVMNLQDAGAISADQALEMMLSAYEAHAAVTVTA